jgi:hypothetical protein
MAVTQMILPVLVITCLAAPAMMYYNFVITGSATRLPQAFYDQTHFPRLNWLGLPNNSALHHSNPQLDDFFCRRAFVEYTKLHSPGGWLSVITAGRLYVFWAFFLGSTLTPVLVALVWTLPDRRVRVLWICAGCLTAAVCIGVWWKVHYIAPFTAGLCVLIAQSIRHIYHVKISAAPLGKVLVRTMLTVAILSAFCDTFALAFYHVRFQEKLPRQALLDRLRAIPGQHLVIVHYGPDHDTHFEYVYNDADIDASRVIWARELGEHEDKQLLNYYKNRMVWILDADSKPAPRLMTLAESKSVKLSGSTNSPIQH